MDALRLLVTGIAHDDCYYATDLYKEHSVYGIVGTPGIGRTTEQMKKQENYVGWDFENTWKMGEDGYPELRFDENH